MVMVLIVDSELLNGFAKHKEFFEANINAFYVVGVNNDRLDISDVAAMAACDARFRVAPIKDKKAVMIATILKDEYYWNDVVIISADKSMPVISVMHNSYTSRLIIESSFDEAIKEIKKYKAEEGKKRREVYDEVLNGSKKDDTADTADTVDTDDTSDTAATADIDATADTADTD